MRLHRWVLTTFIVLLSGGATSAQVMAAELKPATRAAFDRYVKLVATRLGDDLKNNRPFLRIDAASKKDELLRKLRNGEVVTERLQERDNGREVQVPDGMLHHWIATVFIPSGKLTPALQLLQDYDHHKDLYKSEVVGSKLLSRQGNHFKAYLRFYKKKVIGVTLNTEHAADYVTVSPLRAYSSSQTTKIAEVENAGEKTEREKPVGKDGGFLWALNSYWRLEEKDGGLYIQCEAVTLTRDIPALVSWVVKPFVTEVPRESLYNTMNSTRIGLQKRLSAGANK